MSTQQTLASSEGDGESSGAGTADFTVSLRTPTAGSLCVGYVESLMQMRERELANNRSWFREFRPWKASSMLSIFRNRMCLDFLHNTEHSHVLLIDSDIGFPVDILDTFYAFLQRHPEYECVGINYVISLDDGLSPAIYIRKPGQDTAENMGREAFVSLLKADDLADKPALDRYIEVNGTGAGCMLISRTVLEKMLATYDPAQPFFAVETIRGVVHGEDMTFIDRLNRMGIKFPLLYDQGLSHYKGDSMMTERALF